MQIYIMKTRLYADNDLLWSWNNYVLYDKDEVERYQKEMHNLGAEMVRRFLPVFCEYRETRRGQIIERCGEKYKTWKHKPDFCVKTEFEECPGAPLSAFKDFPTDRAIQYFKERGVSLAINV